MKRKTALLALAGLFALSANSYAAGGGYSSTIIAPTVSIKNQWYQKDFSVPSSIEKTGKMTTVYYSWAYSRNQAGLMVSLCTSNNVACFNVTNAQSGSVDFSSYNIAPNQPLTLKAMVSGTGTMAPLNGKQSQVTVNYLIGN
ncbi:flagellar protein FlhE [Enterobacteriaceae bacterium H11S18]|uniref:flagellar protein FlhE n=1 Tax=Dryocola clanedunensis TaxID=2925396 RepID=UPI0022F04906|nr:flagellar protein FlhE [Dryocola clanedunensis]MCT4708763.1 flagellar protein FlhE [Dryocola clanedunensis]